MRKPLTEPQARALRLVAGGAARIRDLTAMHVGRTTINALSDAGLIDTVRFPGAVYATDLGRAALAEQEKGDA